MSEPLGEVIAASTTSLTAQVPRGAEAPAFGTFVACEVPGGEALGVVSAVRSATLDPYRRPTAYGLPADELAAQQPQLAELLVGEFDVILIGWQGDVSWRAMPPSRPPRLHSFVREAWSLAIRVVCADEVWLRTLVAAEADDHLLAAACRAAVAGLAGDQAQQRQLTIRLGRGLARLLGDDYDRLRSLLARLAA